MYVVTIKESKSETTRAENIHPLFLRYLIRPDRSNSLGGVVEAAVVEVSMVS